MERSATAKAVNYFRKNASISDVLHGSEYASDICTLPFGNESKTAKTFGNLFSCKIYNESIEMVFIKHFRKLFMFLVKIHNL